MLDDWVEPDRTSQRKDEDEDELEMAVEQGRYTAEEAPRPDELGRWAGRLSAPATGRRTPGVLRQSEAIASLRVALGRMTAAVFSASRT